MIIEKVIIEPGQWNLKVYTAVAGEPIFIANNSSVLGSRLKVKSSALVWEVIRAYRQEF
jgi:hypothetical protein